MYYQNQLPQLTCKNGIFKNELLYSLIICVLDAMLCVNSILLQVGFPNFPYLNSFYKPMSTEGQITVLDLGL